MDERISGVSPVTLMALYGDGKLKAGMKRAVKFTPHYWAAKGVQAAIRKRKRRRLHGEDLYGYSPRFLSMGEEVELLAAAKKKKAKAKKKSGFMTAVRKVGKVTSGITTGVASAIGVPKPMLNALSKIDPTKKGQSVKKVAQIMVPKSTAVQSGFIPFDLKKIDVKKAAIIGGSALVGVIILKSLLSGR